MENVGSGIKLFQQKTERRCLTPSGQLWHSHHRGVVRTASAPSQPSLRSKNYMKSDHRFTRPLSHLRIFAAGTLISAAAALGFTAVKISSRPPSGDSDRQAQ